MRYAHASEQGFSAVELLITLFVAVAFLVAGYQLFDVVVRNGGDVRAESRAANVAYGYLRQYSAVTSNPCVASTPLPTTGITVDSLTNVTISVVVTCPQADTPAVSKVEAIISYGDPLKELRHATLADTSKISVTPGGDTTNGMVNQWRLNGNGDPAAGDITLNPVGGASPTTNRAGQPNMAYAVDASGVYQNLISESTTVLKNTDSTVSLWVYSATSINSGGFIKIGNGASGYGIGVGNANFQNTNPGTAIIMLFEGVRWIATTTNLGTGWHHIVMSLDSSGVPSAYRDGSLIGSYPGTNAIQPTNRVTVGATSDGRRYTGSIDDVRLYNRELTATEVLQIYQAGPQ